jgi:hypothetical protein
MSEPILTDGGGTSEARVGPVAIRCMSADAHEALDEAVKLWEAQHDGGDIHATQWSVYSTFYWLFRYSGMIRYGSEETR